MKKLSNVNINAPSEKEQKVVGGYLWLYSFLKYRLGWGWLILLLLWVNVWMGIVVLSLSMIHSFFIPLFGMVFLFTLYFWLRNRSIKKGTYNKTWKASLFAGIAAYLLTILLVFLSGLFYFML